MYTTLVRKWSPAINIVSHRDLSVLEVRHIWDSAQLLNHALPCRSWIDLGSGGGFPGLVVAILDCQDAEPIQMHLVERDKRKAAFLRHAVHALNLAVEISTCPIEMLNIQKADIISARALAPLARLLDLCYPLAGAKTRLLLPKGKKWKEEIDLAHRRWRFDAIPHKSLTDSNSVVLEIMNVHPRLTKDR